MKKKGRKREEKGRENERKGKKKETKREEKWRQNGRKMEAKWKKKGSGGSPRESRLPKLYLFSMKIWKNISYFSLHCLLKYELFEHILMLKMLDFY